MLKVLIVEDEMIVRINLATLINWEKNGFVICGEAANGKEAIEKIEKHRPHIVIMDVVMPIMDGIELSCYISRKYKNIKMIVLSSYGEFDYVRETLKNGAVDYILKHSLNPSALLDVLNKAKTQIEEEIRQENERIKAKEKLKLAIDAIKENYIRQLILGINTDKITNDFELFQLWLGEKKIIVVSMQVLNYLIITNNYSEKEKEMLIHSIINVANQIMSRIKNGMIAHIEKGRFILLFYCENEKSEASIHQWTYNVMERISNAINNFLDIDVVWGSTGYPCKKYFEIPENYNIACKMMEEKLNAKPCHEQNQYKKVISLSISQEKKLLSAIEMKDIEQVNEILDFIFRELEEYRANYDSVQIITAELLTIASKACKEFGIECEDIFNLEKNKINSLMQKMDVKGIYEWIKSIYLRLIELAKAKCIEGGFSEYINNAIFYIRKNYNEDISLNKVAENVGISPSYLSRLFRDETGNSFVSYLNNIRIDMAKKLINEGEKNIKTLYKKVGFNNYNYFFTVFKEIVGCTPLVYAKKMKNAKSTRNNSTVNARIHSRIV